MSPLYCLFAVLFFISAFLIFYTYVLFPSLLSRLSSRQGPAKKPEDAIFPVTIIISVFNEEGVIEEKLNSILSSDFPAGQLEILIGSDASTDSTNKKVSRFVFDYPNVKLFEYPERRGKPAVINDLVKHASNDIIILTDANVFFENNTIRKLVSPFTEGRVGLIGANILNIGLRKDGISIQEKSYIQRENLIKYREGKLWGCMMGPFGGCYALRKELFENIPAGFLVDDFFISMKVMEKGFKCINQLDAVCYEDVSNDIRQEFRRKARISAGNYQNLRVFSSFLLKPFTPVGFCFISHKVLRWITPFLILISILSLGVLSTYHRGFLLMFIFELAMLTTPLLDFLLGKMSIHLKILRFISYFSYMNLALIKGFLNYATGIKSGIWQPTKRAK